MAKPIDPKRVKEILEVNQTLDAIVKKIIDLIRTTLASLPGRQVRALLIQKLETSLTELKEEVREEG